MQIINFITYLSFIYFHRALKSPNIYLFAILLKNIDYICMNKIFSRVTRINIHIFALQIPQNPRVFCNVNFVDELNV